MGDMAGLCEFVPPYLLQRIAAAQIDLDLTMCSQGTLAMDAELRDRRASAGPATTLSRPADIDRATPQAAARWTVHSAEHDTALPGSPVRAEGEPASGDEAVDEAYVGTEATIAFYLEVLSRQAIDGQGSPVTVTVHYGTNYDNAFWDGQQLVFGDGDGKVFDRFTKPVDVLAHEFAHGVTQHTAGLAYRDQPGAINESVSDVFGAIVKQRVLGHTSADADWLIGEGLFMPGINGRALRSMSEPGTAYDDGVIGKDPQVGTMSDYVQTSDDNGGVHINSGIANRAFYLAATSMGGSSWDQAGPIWYHALTSGSVTASTDFAGFAQATVDSAASLYDEATAAQVRSAWEQVEVAPMAPSPAPLPSSPGGGRTVGVRRTGGFAGRTVAAEIDPTTSPKGSEVRELIERIDFSAVAEAPPQPDRFVYVFTVYGWQVTVAEQQLTGDLARLADLVLGND